MDTIAGLVSVAIPTYKGKYLYKSINSALNQDYKNIEIIVVNDHSPYDIESIVYSFNDPRIHYYFNPKNIGKEDPTINWNKCLEYANGEFFVLLCDDDILYPTFVEELLKLANKYPDCNVFHSPKCIIDGNGVIIKEEDLWPEWESLNDFYKQKKKYNRFHTITEFLYRTDYIKKLKYIEFPVAWGSDDISIINFAKKGGIASINKRLAAFRVNDEHISKDDTHLYEKAKARILNFLWLAEFFEGDKYNAQYMEHLGKLMKEFIKRAKYIDKFRILIIVPHQTWNCLKKIKVLVGIILFRYKHPGYGAIGV